MRDIPNTLKRQFKSWCLHNDVSMSGVIVDFMKALVATDPTLRRIAKEWEVEHGESVRTSHGGFVVIKGPRREKIKAPLPQQKRR